MKTTKLLFKTPKTISFLATLLLIFVTQFTTAQTVHTVDNRPQSGAMYTTVQAAVNASSPGDIIQIHSSPTNYGNVSVTKEYLTLIGFGHNPVNADGLRAYINSISVNTAANNCIIKGLGVGNISVYGADVQIVNNLILNTVSAGSGASTIADNLEIKGNYFANANYEIGISQSNAQNWTITNNYFNNSIIYSLEQNTEFTNNIVVQNVTNSWSFQQCANPVVSNNLFLFPGGDKTSILLDSSTINFTNCLTHSYDFTGSAIADLPGANNFNNMKPIFENAPDATLTAFYDNDYKLAAGSPGENGGFDGTDIGIFGRSFEFDVNGRVDLLPYPTAINIINTVLKPSQDLNVEFSATIKQ